MYRTIKLRISEGTHLKVGKDRIIYAGMPSEEVYSIAQLRETGQGAYSWNLFFPKNRQNIIINGVNILVENVTQDDISLKFSYPFVNRNYSGPIEGSQQQNLTI